MSTTEASLLDWLNGLECSESELSSLSQLVNGVVLYSVLERVDGEHFNAAETLHFDDKRLSYKLNLTKVLRGLSSYFADVLDMPRELDIDITAVMGEDEAVQTAELIKLTTAVLAAAAQCEGREEFIGVIMTLPEQSQHDLMQLLHEWMEAGGDGEEEDGDSDGDGDYGIDDRSRAEMDSASAAELLAAQEQVEDLQSELRALRARTADQAMDIDDLKSAKSRVELELDELRARMSVMREEEGSSTSALESALRDMQSSRDELLDRLEEQQRVLHSTQDKLDTQLSENDMLVAENKELTDFNDVLQARVSSLQKAEAQLHRYKSRLEDSTTELLEVRDQLAEMEDKKDELESELSLMKSSAASMETLKARNNDLQMNLTEASVEKEELRRQLASARSSITALKQELLTASAAGAGDEEEDDDAYLRMLKDELSKVKQQLRDSRAEVRSLKASGSSGSDGSDGSSGSGGGDSAAAAELESLAAVRASLESQLVDLRVRNSQLEAKLEEAVASGGGGSGGGDGAAAAAAAAGSAGSGVTLEAIKSSEAYVAMKNRLMAAVNEKDAKVTSMDEELRRTKQKMARVIDYARRQMGGVVREVEQLKADAVESRSAVNKYKVKLERLSSKRNADRERFKRERALLASAIYELGREIQSRALLADATPAPVSWLESQRKALASRQ